MNLVLAFLFAGFMCLIGQLILDNTKLTPGHVTSIFTILGAFLGLLDIYPKLINCFGGGATIIISNFGYMLYKGAQIGFLEEGVIGLFSGLLKYSSCAISSAILFSFFLTILFKPKD